MKDETAETVIVFLLTGPPAASKATTVSVSSSGYSTPVKPPPDATTFKPGTTAVKFYVSGASQRSLWSTRDAHRMYTLTCLVVIPTTLDAV